MAQYCPAGHTRHDATLGLPRFGLYVPAGQPTGAGVPASQYAPTGHTSPPRPPAGVAVPDPPLQYRPAAHGPVGRCSPGVAQYCPAGHALHCPASRSCVALLNVPFGHRNSVAYAVPFGQYDPGGHTVGCV